MKIKNAKSTLVWISCSVGLVLAFAVGMLTAQAPVKGSHVDRRETWTFKSPEAAADALIVAAEKFDVDTLNRIFGTGAQDIIFTNEPAHDKEIATAFAAQGRARTSF